MQMLKSVLFFLAIGLLLTHWRQAVTIARSDKGMDNPVLRWFMKTASEKGHKAEDGLALWFLGWIVIGLLSVAILWESFVYFPVVCIAIALEGFFVYTKIKQGIKPNLEF